MSRSDYSDYIVMGVAMNAIMLFLHAMSTPALTDLLYGVVVRAPFIAVSGIIAVFAVRYMRRGNWES